MRFIKSFLIIILFVFILPCVLYGQEISNLRAKTISISSDTITIDSLSIVPGTFILDANNKNIPDSLYTINFWEGTINLSNTLVKKYSKLTMQYRVFPKTFTKSFFEKEVQSVQKIPDQVFTYEKLQSQQPKSRPNTFNPNSIIQAGSIGRGLTVGNNQDVSINSTLNLQLSGKISDNLNIAGVISDDNIPVQPDGTTQEIQQLDKVYMKVYNEQTQITGGDFVVENTTGQFLDFQRKVKGGEVKHTFNKKGKSQITSSLSGAISRGKYCVKSFSGQEGNQGPYRLTGCDGESQITVLAGSERVYIDGKKLKRGKQNDYTIHYNTAELNFTANQPITRDKRIKVEFEYAIRSYARFSVFTKNRVKTEKGHLWINFYNETDAKNQTLAQDLSDHQKQLLRAAGDQLDDAVVPYVDTVPYDNDRILYQKTDTMVDGKTYSIYKYSTTPDLAKYKVGFSYTGQGSGNYVIAQSAANGRVYKWVPPKNGVPQGEYSPVRRLSAPTSHQILQLGGKTQLNSLTSTSYELAFSNNDKNTFSSKDQNDNKGYAVKFGINRNFQFLDTTKTTLNTTLNYRGIHENYQSAGRMKSIEFQRNWNIPEQSFQTNEHLIQNSIHIVRKSLGNLNYNFETLQYPNIYEGYKNQLSTRFQVGNFHVDLWGNILHTNGRNQNTRFVRYQADINKQFKYLIMGIKPEGEQNRWKPSDSDSLTSRSFAFSSWEFYITNPDTARNNYFASYKIRDDYAPGETNFRKITAAQDINIGYTIHTIPNHTLQSKLTYRELNVTDSTPSAIKPEENLTGRLEHNGRWFQSFLTSSTFWEIGSGLEPKREFTYLKVSAGKGTYTWTDYNSNDVKELNEFEQANFIDQANYIRVYRPSGNYIKTRHHELTQTLRILPAKLIKTTQGVGKQLKKFSNQVAYNIKRKTQNTGLWENANPIRQSFRDTNIISQSASIRNKLSYNRSNPIYQIHYIFLKTKSKSAMVNGMETRNALTHEIQTHWNITQQTSIINKARYKENNQQSEYFKNSDYQIETYSNDLTFRYRPVSNIQWELSYVFQDKTNRTGKEETTQHNLGTSLKWSKLKSFNLQLRANFIHFDYPYSENTPIAYEMLEGLKPGKNGTWSVTIQKNLYKNLQLNFHYNGRVSEQNQAIHTGQFEVRANF